MKNTVENEIGTPEQLEQAVKRKFHFWAYSSANLGKLSILDEGRKGKIVFLEFGGNRWIMDEFSIVMKSKITGLVNIQRENDLQKIEMLDLIFLNRSFAVLRLKREGEEERYSAILHGEDFSLRFSLYLVCQDDRKAFWLANIHSAQTEHFIAIHDTPTVCAEKELLRHALICEETLIHE